MLAFQPVAVADRAAIEAFTKPLHLENSELSFINLLIWGLDDKIKWAATKEALYIRLQYDPKLPPFCFPPVPKEPDRCDYAALVRTAAEALQAENAPVKFRSVCGPFVDLFAAQCPQYTLTLDRDTCDYVYLAESLVTLRGKKLHSKRNHINRFRATTAFEYRALHSEDAATCMALYQEWMEHKDPSIPGIAGERRALEFMLPKLDELQLFAGGIFVDNALVAFSVGEKLHPDVAVVHIEKASHLFPELYAVINQQFAEHAFSDVELINREEDMGIEGMRKAKLSYDPVKLIEKYDAVPVK